MCICCKKNKARSERRRVNRAAKRGKAPVTAEAAVPPADPVKGGLGEFPVCPSTQGTLYHPPYTIFF